MYTDLIEIVLISPNVECSLIGSWPFLVSLQWHNEPFVHQGHLLGGFFGHSCGGSIINEYQVLTAAHCFTRYY